MSHSRRLLLRHWWHKEFFFSCRWTQSLFVIWQAWAEASRTPSPTTNPPPLNRRASRGRAWWVILQQQQQQQPMRWRQLSMRASQRQGRSVRRGLWDASEWTKSRSLSVSVAGSVTMVVDVVCSSDHWLTSTQSGKFIGWSPLGLQ